jgi:hypothetical protein
MIIDCESSSVGAKALYIQMRTAHLHSLGHNRPPLYIEVNVFINCTQRTWRFPFAQLAFTLYQPHKELVFYIKDWNFLSGLF